MSVPRQQSHESLLSMYKDMEMGTFVANSVSGIWQDRRREDKQLIDSLLSHFSKSRPGCAKARHTAALRKSSEPNTCWLGQKVNY